jgi:streptomycin 6-kinase
MLRLSEEFQRTNRELHGRMGVEWLDRLPATLDECARRWSLVVGEAFEPLSYNYVARATRAGGEKVVLKVGFPCRELRTEEEALGLFDGRGCVRLLDSDMGLGALLLERLEPGTALAVLADEERDEEATRAAAGVMRELWRPAPAGHGFPSVADWAAGLKKMRARFGGGCGPLPPALVLEAEGLLRELFDSSGAPVLLHGDLHHGNILDAGRGRWLAIDPKGLVGEPAYEAGALLRNPLPQLLRMRRPLEALRRRVEVFAAALGVDRERVRGWGVAQAVLSAWWTIEDNGSGWEPTIECARLLASLR